MTDPQPPADPAELAVARAILTAAGQALARTARTDPGLADRATAAIAAQRHDIRAVFDRGADDDPDPRSLRYAVYVPNHTLDDMIPIVVVPWTDLPMSWDQVLDELARCNQRRADGQL